MKYLNDITKPIMFMKEALLLASKAKEKTYPNPMVGAVIVRRGKIIGKGYHKKAGRDHAEVVAIKSVRNKKLLKGATMFVTLEPCSHFGKTPPCTKAIVEAGIKELFIAIKDPNPLVRGRGIEFIKRNSIKVHTGFLSEEATCLNRKYIRRITTGLPYITIKLAQSLDGKIAARDGSSKWISSEASRKYVKKIRSEFNGVLVGRNTIEKDDPFLLDENKKGHDTIRIVVDTKLKMSLKSNLIKTLDKAPIIIGTTFLADKNKLKILGNLNNLTVVQSPIKAGKVSLKSFLKKLAKMGITSILVEGGGELVGNLIDENLVNEVIFFISPQILGGDMVSVKGKGVKNIKNAIKLKNKKITSMGEDILIKGEICSQG